MFLKNRHFLKLLDFTPAEIEGLIDLAAELKAKKKTNGQKLTKSTACYRMGYLNARRDRSIANKAYKKKH